MIMHFYHLTSPPILEMTQWIRNKRDSIKCQKWGDVQICEIYWHQLDLHFFNIIHQNQLPLIKNYLSLWSSTLKDHTWSISWLLVVSYVHFWPVWSHQAAPLVINATGLQWTVKQGKSWFFGLGITRWVGRFKLNDYFAHRETFRHCAWSVLASNLKTFIWLINPLQLY